MVKGLKYWLKAANMIEGLNNDLTDFSKLLLDNDPYLDDLFSWTLIHYALMDNARENAKELLENYIKSVGDATGIEYTVNWVYLDSENNTPTETTDAE